MLEEATGRKILVREGAHTESILQIRYQIGDLVRNPHCLAFEVARRVLDILVLR